MRVYAPILMSLIFGLILIFTASRLVQYWQKYSKYLEVIRKTPRYLLLLLGLGALSWFAGRVLNQPGMIITGSSLMVLMNLTLFLGILYSLPVWVILPLVRNYQRGRIPPPVQQPRDPSRRHFIRVTAAALPALAFGTSVSGMAQSFSDVRFPLKKMTFERLPAGLEGMKILHLSDLHMGYYFHPGDLESLLIRAGELKPDLILVTGDIADDLSLLPEALNLLGRAGAPLGTFASLGNHEYLRGIDTVLDAFGRADVPLLVNQNLTLRRNGTSFQLIGLDDPRKLKDNLHPFLRKSLSDAMSGADDQKFSILMSHRPKVLDHVDPYNIDLVLSGHTHGGQIRMNGESLLRNVTDHAPYIWGEYQKGRTRMYTSSGVGHWFPFRLNCPPEAPIITLTGKTSV